MPVYACPMAAYRWTVLRAGEFRLDGGSMFGLVPRAVWSRACEPDEKGRIRVQHNCVLLERADSPSKGEPLDAPRTILLEAGTGDKLDEKSRAIFALENRSIADALHEAGKRCEDVGAVVVSHLHFDHAGGLTRLCRPGESPDWSGPASCFSGARPDHGVKLTFPHAAIHAQSREWDDARAARSVMTRTYFADHLEPIAPRLQLADSPRPFPTGYTPDRDELPRSTLEQRTTEVAPGVFVFLVPGHTWGQQATLFTDDRGRTVVFTPDVMPTAWHVGAAYSLGYDVEPYTSMINRRWFLEEAAARDWLLVLDHEPGTPCRRARRNDSGWYDLIEAEK